MLSGTLSTLGVGSQSIIMSMEESLGMGVRTLGMRVTAPKTEFEYRESIKEYLKNLQNVAQRGVMPTTHEKRELRIERWKHAAEPRCWKSMTAGPGPARVGVDERRVQSVMVSKRVMMMSGKNEVER